MVLTTGGTGLTLLLALHTQVPPFKLSLEEENATLKRQVTCLTKRLGAAEAEIALREECRQLLKELFKVR